MDLKDYLGIFKRRRKLIFISAILILIVYILIIYHQPLSYQTQASIILSDPRYFFPSQFESTPSFIMTPENQLHMMNTRPFAQKVTKRLRKV